jgi:hypothetical protein
LRPIFYIIEVQESLDSLRYHDFFYKIVTTF